MSSKKHVNNEWFVVSINDKDVADMLLVLQRQEAADRNRAKRKQKKERQQKEKAMIKQIEGDFVEIPSEL